MNMISTISTIYSSPAIQALSPAPFSSVYPINYWGDFLAIKLKESISRIKENVIQMENIVSDLLKLSEKSQEKVQFKNIDPVQLVKEILVSFEDEINV